MSSQNWIFYSMIKLCQGVYDGKFMPLGILCYRYARWYVMVKVCQKGYDGKGMPEDMSQQGHARLYMMVWVCRTMYDRKAYQRVHDGKGMPEEFCITLFVPILRSREDSMSCDLFIGVKSLVHARIVVERFIEILF